MNYKFNKQKLNNQLKFVKWIVWWTKDIATINQKLSDYKYLIFKEKSRFRPIKFKSNYIDKQKLHWALRKFYYGGERGSDDIHFFYNQLCKD